MSVTLASAHAGNKALIHACVNNKSGKIKIIGANSNCPSNYRSLDWNIQGPAGISGLEVVTMNSDTQIAARIDVFVECPAGKQVLGAAQPLAVTLTPASARVPLTARINR